MSRMSGPRRNKMYDFLADRDGEYCFIGGEEGNKETLVVDHWDNDNSNNDPSNLHLICRWANCVKNPRGPGKKKIRSLVYVCDNRDRMLIEPPKTVSAEFLKNQIAEPAFLHWLFAQVVKHDKILLSDATDCGAKVARVSQITVGRYLKKAICEESIFHVVEVSDCRGRYIEFRPEWNTFRKTEEEKQKLDKWTRNWKKDVFERNPGIRGSSKKDEPPQEQSIKDVDPPAIEQHT